MLALAATKTLSLPAWVQIGAVLISGLGSGLFVQWLADRRSKRLEPAKNREREANAMKTAVETVESALGVAQGRIVELEKRVSEMTLKVGELQGKLDYATSDRDRISTELNLALIERARLQYQITELDERLKTRKLDDLMTVSPPDAIVMVELKTGLITYATEGVFALLGYVPAMLVGEPIEKLVPNAKRKMHQKQREDYAAHPETRAMGMGKVLGLEAVHASGEVVEVEISLHPTGDGRVLALIKRRDPSKAH